MGLFSFLKGAGEKLFGTKSSDAVTTAADTAAAEKAQKIAAMQSFVLGLGLEVQNLDIDLDGDVVTVYGQASNQAEKEKLILALGNVQGVASVDDRVSVIAALEPEAELYEVKSGDSLSKISKHFYGDPMRYNEIFEANKPLLSHPDKIYPGQMLRIPK